MSDRLAELINEWEPLQHAAIVGRKSMYDYRGDNIEECDGYAMTVNLMLKKDSIARDIKYLMVSEDDPHYFIMLDRLESNIKSYRDLMILNTMKSS